MTGSAAISFKEYLRLVTLRAEDAAAVPEYDDFILKIWELFALRAAAENYYARHRHVAKSRHGALPLPWDEIRMTLERGGPPENILTDVARHHSHTLEALAGNMRKVLMRVREMTALERVRQLDAHCLRWLVRRPGYSAAEKAGARQEILGVVRKENYDTLENRVLVDFLGRCRAQAAIYLRRYGAKWPAHATVANVRRLQNLCTAMLEAPECRNVRRLQEFPVPNHVLQQDRLYSRVWIEYCRFARQDDVAERLWNRREEVADVYERLCGGIEMHCSAKAKYSTPIWFNVLDGMHDILEAPVWDNELADEPVCDAECVRDEETVVVDLAFPWDGRDVMVTPKAHPNARPFIQNPHKPSLERGDEKRMEEILERRDEERLAAYFQHLHYLRGGRRWVVLVPDHWDAEWLEKTIRARPPALAAREDVFLLWRSVAAALGFQTMQRKPARGETLLVEDGYCRNKFNAIAIRFADDGEGGAIPQRASLRLHGEDAPGGDVRFVVECADGDEERLRELRGNAAHVCKAGWACGDDALLPAGAKEYLRRSAAGKIPYYDELDAIWLVVVDGNEEVVFKALAEHEECWPGGKPHIREVTAGTLHGGSKELLLYIAEGDAHDDSHLKEWKVEFDADTKDDAEIKCRAKITPGQGLAAASFFAPFLEREKVVDIGSATPSGMTRIGIERELKRHFPPTMPFVEACKEMWTQDVKDAINDYMLHGTAIRDAGLFAKAQSYWGPVDPSAARHAGARRYGVSRVFDKDAMSPIDRLKRENVFGNAPGSRLPDPARRRHFATLFRKLARETLNGASYIRLLAWTYQFDNPDLEPLRKRLHEKYVARNQTLDATETSFCANNFDGGDPRTGELLRHALENIAASDCSENNLRLAYNLMQFHPTAIKACDSGLCENAFRALMDAFNNYPFYTMGGLLFRRWGGRNSTKMAGYFIKCMLFILHRRRYDHACLANPHGWERTKDANGRERLVPGGLLAEKLPWEEANSGTLKSHEAMRNALVDYVNGRGTLDGIPSN